MNVFTCEILFVTYFLLLAGCKHLTLVAIKRNILSKIITMNFNFTYTNTFTNIKMVIDFVDILKVQKLITFP